MEVKKISTLERYEIEPIVEDSVEDGHRFLKRLIDDYYTGTNRFNKPGEALFLMIISNEIAGIGGLNQDPYMSNEGYGRVRHLYVLRKFRSKGVGKTILREIINEASKHFKVLGLRTYNDVADKMYCSNGFIKGDKFDHATHYMYLKTESK